MVLSDNDGKTRNDNSGGWSPIKKVAALPYRQNHGLFFPNMLSGIYFCQAQRMETQPVKNKESQTCFICHTLSLQCWPSGGTGVDRSRPS